MWLTLIGIIIGFFVGLGISSLVGYAEDQIIFAGSSGVNQMDCESIEEKAYRELCKQNQSNFNKGISVFQLVGLFGPWVLISVTLAKIDEVL